MINRCPGWKKSQIAKEKKQKHKMQETAELQDMKRKGVCWDEKTETIEVRGKARRVRDK